jgi:hypothetical protein
MSIMRNLALSIILVVSLVFFIPSISDAGLTTKKGRVKSFKNFQQTTISSTRSVGFNVGQRDSAKPMMKSQLGLGSSMWEHLFTSKLSQGAFWQSISVDKDMLSKAVFACEGGIFMMDITHNLFIELHKTIIQRRSQIYTGTCSIDGDTISFRLLSPKGAIVGTFTKGKLPTGLSTDYKDTVGEMSIGSKDIVFAKIGTRLQIENAIRSDAAKLSDSSVLLEMDLQQDVTNAADKIRGVGDLMNELGFGRGLGSGGGLSIGGEVMLGSGRGLPGNIESELEDFFSGQSTENLGQAGLDAIGARGSVRENADGGGSASNGTDTIEWDSDGNITSDTRNGDTAGGNTNDEEIGGALHDGGDGGSLQDNGDIIAGNGDVLGNIDTGDAGEVSEVLGAMGMGEEEVRGKLADMGFSEDEINDAMGGGAGDGGDNGGSDDGDSGGNDDGDNSNGGSDDGEDDDDDDGEDDDDDGEDDDDDDGEDDDDDGNNDDNKDDDDDDDDDATTPADPYEDDNDGEGEDPYAHIINSELRAAIVSAVMEAGGIGRVGNFGSLKEDDGVGSSLYDDLPPALLEIVIREVRKAATIGRVANFGTLGENEMPEEGEGNLPFLFATKRGEVINFGPEGKNAQQNNQVNNGTTFSTIFSSAWNSFKGFFGFGNANITQGGTVQNKTTANTD